MARMRISLRGKAAQRGIVGLIDLQEKLDCKMLNEEYKKKLILEFLESIADDVQVDAGPNLLEIIVR